MRLPDFSRNLSRVHVLSHLFLDFLQPYALQSPLLHHFVPFSDKIVLTCRPSAHQSPLRHLLHVLGEFSKSSSNVLYRSYVESMSGFMAWPWISNPAISKFPFLSMCALMPCQRDPFLEKLDAFRGFSLIIVGPSTFSSISSVTSLCQYRLLQVHRAMPTE